MRVTELFSPPPAPQRRRQIRCKRTLALLACLAIATTARAGGGPENVLLVVNANSAGSKKVANHYVRLRDLPASNVLYLDYRGPLEKATGEQFREQILQPLLQAIDARGLSLQIDMVAYSTDFPWLVNLRGDYPEEVKLSSQQRPVASITGATYLFPYVMSKHPGVVSLDTNWYVPAPKGSPNKRNLSRCQTVAGVPSLAFRSRYAWLEGGKRSLNVKKGQRYLMATMLGVTTGRGSTVDEVIASLDRAVEAELSPPQGTFYFVRNNSPRSTPRHNCYPAVIEELGKLGAKAQLRIGNEPKQQVDIAGVMAGTAKIHFDKAGMRILPGAICEHLTSYGGVMSAASTQSTLAEWIRAGATASCGTIAEPYAIQAKFPLPSLQLHYRRGCSVAEAFYQSVAAPYQLLIVGDPLCQPWAKRPGLNVEGWPDSAGPGDLSTLGLAELGITSSATESENPQETESEEPPPALKVIPKVTPTAGRGVARWELFVDGKLRMRLPTGRGTSFTAEQLGPGWHDLCCVAINPDPLEGQRRQLGGIEILEVAGRVYDPVRLQAGTSPLSVAASAEGAERIVIRQGLRQVATIEGSRGEAVLSAETLGAGPVRLQAVAEPSGAASPPLWLRATPERLGG